MEVKRLGKNTFFFQIHIKIQDWLAVALYPILSKASMKVNLSCCRLGLVTGHLFIGGITTFFIQTSAIEWKPSLGF